MSENKDAKIIEERLVKESKEIPKVESLDFSNKTFVFDGSFSRFKFRGKWISAKEWWENYEQLNFPRYEDYISAFDKERNPVAKKIIEAGGYVRQSISGKTDYYVVEDTIDQTSSRYNNYNEYVKQLEKGKPIIAITIKNLKELLGIEETKKNELAEKISWTDKYGVIDIFDPSGSEIAEVYADNNYVDEIHVTGDTCKDWVYKIADNKKIVYVTDYIGKEESITLPSTIEGMKAELTWLSAPGGCRFKQCKAKKVLVPGSYKEVPDHFFDDNEYIEEVVIGYGISEIGSSFCKNSKNLTNVYLPDTITNVCFDCLKGTEWMNKQGGEAIAGTILIHRYGLTSEGKSSVYRVPEGITCIAQNAFFSEYDNVECPYYIHRIELPASMKYISDYAFFALDVETIKLPSSVVKIGEHAFRGTKIETLYRNKNEDMLIIGDILSDIYLHNYNEKIQIPNGIRVISDKVMQSSFDRPEHIVFPDSLEEICEQSQWRGVKQVDVNNKLRVIGSNCFAGSEELKEIYLPDSLEIVEDHAFMGSGLNNISIPGSVKEIKYFSFGRCENLESVDLREGVEIISESAFEGCKSLKNVSLPNTLKSIGYRAFALCESLESIIIPSSVKEIDEEAFAGCGEIKIITNTNS